MKRKENMKATGLSAGGFYTPLADVSACGGLVQNPGTRITKIKLRVRAEINSQILSVEAPGWQSAKEQEYQAYSKLSQRSQPGCIGA